MRMRAEIVFQDNRTFSIYDERGNLLGTYDAAESSLREQMVNSMADRKIVPEKAAVVAEREWDEDGIRFTYEEAQRMQGWLSNVAGELMFDERGLYGNVSRIVKMLKRRIQATERWRIENVAPDAENHITGRVRRQGEKRNPVGNRSSKSKKVASGRPKVGFRRAAEILGEREGKSAGD